MQTPPGGLPLFMADAPPGQVSDRADEDKMYGAILDYRLQKHDQMYQNSKRRKRINCLPAIAAFFIPWFAFLLVSTLVSFYFHYRAPVTTCLIIGLITLGALGNLFDNVKGWKESKDGSFFKMYIAVMTVIAVVSAWISGDLAFWKWMQPGYQYAHLATYTNVDPSMQSMYTGQTLSTPGKRYQDAGTIYFKAGSELNVSQAMSFKLGDLYCVVPIVNPDCQKNCGHDFWAVGINCCGEDSADFRCGDYGKRSLSGMRMMNENNRALYRLAVMQAEGIHRATGLVSNHPLFFYWMEDPVAEVSKWRKKGYRLYIIGMLATFTLNAVTLFAYIQWGRSSGKMV